LTTFPDQISPEHMALLSLARATFRARDDRVLWNSDPEEACERHGALCDALWTELENQIAAADGLVIVHQHPALKRQKMIANMRREIVQAAQNAITEALEELAKGPMLDSYE
jgi:hypothetical protein